MASAIYFNLKYILPCLETPEQQNLEIRHHGWLALIPAIAVAKASWQRIFFRELQREIAGRPMRMIDAAGIFGRLGRSCSCASLAFDDGAAKGSRSLDSGLHAIRSMESTYVTCAPWTVMPSRFEENSRCKTCISWDGFGAHSYLACTFSCSPSGDHVAAIYRHCPA